LGYIDLGQREGASVALGGKRVRPETGGFYIEPTVLDGVANSMRVAQEEIFGPVVVAMPFSDEDDLVRKANDTVYGLGAAVWSSDAKRAHRVAHKLRAGTVWVNCYGAVDPAMPFGGYKESGHGREMGQYAIDLYTEVKSVFANLDD
jgi:aldehyde dehydrogenase (NAD+)/phenylacetaldehyde dehydrogenase